MKSEKIYLFIYGVFVVFLLQLTQSVSAATIYADEVYPYWQSNNATECLQNAIDQANNGDTVVIREMAGHWMIHEQIDLGGNMTIEIEEDVVIRPPYNSFHDIYECLFKAYYVNNLTITGYGARVCMRKWDYQNPAIYTASEHRHIFRIYGCTYITIEGLEID